jgi:hypothetical protein
MVSDCETAAMSFIVRLDCWTFQGEQYMSIKRKEQQ